MGTPSSKTHSSTGQVNTNAAEVYDELFLPALIGQWTPRTAEAAGIRPGAHVLDVACGTGSVTIEAARRAGPSGKAVGLDRNAGMLAVARSKDPRIDWRLGMAEELPFDEAIFDAITTQFGLMYFERPEEALREMRRVAAPDGRVAITVWDALDRSPGYAALARLVDEMFGHEVAGELRSPSSWGDADRLRDELRDAGFADAAVTPRAGTARFPSIDTFVHAEVKGWTLGDKIDDDEHADLLTRARQDLTVFAAPDGTVEFELPALIARATSG